MNEILANRSVSVHFVLSTGLIDNTFDALYRVSTQLNRSVAVGGATRDIATNTRVCGYPKQPR